MFSLPHLIYPTYSLLKFSFSSHETIFFPGSLPITDPFLFLNFSFYSYIIVSFEDLIQDTYALRDMANPHLETLSNPQTG